MLILVFMWVSHCSSHGQESPGSFFSFSQAAASVAQLKHSLPAQPDDSLAVQGKRQSANHMAPLFGGL